VATIYRRKRRLPIPLGAKIVEYRGKPYAVWVSRGGRQRKAPLADDGQAVEVVDDNYTVEWFSWDGKRRRLCGGPDKDAAEALGAAKESEEVQRRRGLIDPRQERFAAEAARPILEHLDAFRECLLAKGNTERHTFESCALVRRVIERCGAQHVGDLTASAVQRVVGDIRASGRSLATCNRVLTAVKSFGRWLRRDKRIREEPLADVARFNEAADPRYVRRELTPEEIGRLLDATERRTLPEHEMSGPDRAMVYRAALGTGFRAKELRSLTPRSFTLDADPPTVTGQAAHSKRRRVDCQPITDELAGLLRDWLAGRPEDEPVFAALPLKTVRMIRKDMDAARREWLAEAATDAERKAREKSDFLKWRNAAGAVVDFHSTRHTYISSIVAGGASVKTAQELARHSTPALTIGRYSHTRLHDVRGALQSLPSLKPASPTGGAQQQALRATGTDNATCETGSLSGQQSGQQLDGKRCQNMASGGATEQELRPEGRLPQVVAMSRHETSRQVVAQRGRARTSPTHHGPFPSCGPASRAAT